MLKEHKSLYINKLSTQKETATVIYIFPLHKKTSSYMTQTLTERRKRQFYIVGGDFITSCLIIQQVENFNNNNKKQ